jgi:branched-subunit amino acid transport protein
MIVTSTAAWIAILLTSAGCYALKYLGLSVPQSWLTLPRLIRITGLMPIALLTALVVVNTFATGKSLTIDPRSAGIAVAVGALLLRLPYPVVVLGAAFTSALLNRLT